MSNIKIELNRRFSTGVSDKEVRVNCASFMNDFLKLTHVHSDVYNITIFSGDETAKITIKEDTLAALAKSINTLLETKR